MPYRVIKSTCRGCHGVVSVQHGWWFPEKEPWEYGFTESNANMMTRGMPLDPQTGSEPWRSFLGRVYRV